MADQSELPWRTSTASADHECVAVAILDQCVLIRHSKDPTGSILRFTLSEWGAFLAGVRNGEFDPRRSASSTDTVRASQRLS